MLSHLFDRDIMYVQQYINPFKSVRLVFLSLNNNIIGFYKQSGFRIIVMLRESFNLAPFPPLKAVYLEFTVYFHSYDHFRAGIKLFTGYI